MKHHKINIPKVYITTVPYNFRSYYLWLLYGLYELNEQGKIILSFQKMKLEDRLIHKSQRFREKSQRIRQFFNLQEEPIYSYTSYNLQGFIIYNDKKIKFCYDIADSPFCSILNYYILLTIILRLNVLKKYPLTVFLSPAASTFLTIRMC